MPPKLITHLRRRWRYRNVTSAAGLANLLADRRSNQRRSTAPDFRTMDEALVALGRAGFVVVDAELGGSSISTPDGVLTRRAAVTALASTETKDWLDDVLCQINWSYGFRAGGAVSGDVHADPGRQSGTAVSRFDGRTNRSIGEQMDAEQIGRLFPVRSGVRDELNNAWLVTVFDKNWGRSDLFEFLLDAATIRTANARL